MLLFSVFSVSLQSETPHSVPTLQGSGPRVPPPLPPLPPPPPLSLYPSRLPRTLSDSQTPLLNGTVQREFTVLLTSPGLDSSHKISVTSSLTLHDVHQLY